MVQALVYRAVRRPSTVWQTRHVCASLPIVVVETLDAIAQASGRSRSAVITDALLAHPAIEAGCISGVLQAHPEVADDLTDPARGVDDGR